MEAKIGLVDEIIEKGREEGVITEEELNELKSSPDYSTDEVDETIAFLKEMGVSIVSDDEKEAETYSDGKDLVQAYFHSMGDISILEKDEEVELAKKLNEGKKVIRKILKQIPLTRKVEKKIKNNNEDDPEEDDNLIDKVTNIVIHNLYGFVSDIDILNKKLAFYGGSLVSLEKLIREEKSKKGIEKKYFTICKNC